MATINNNVLSSLTTIVAKMEDVISHLERLEKRYSNSSPLRPPPISLLPPLPSLKPTQIPPPPLPPLFISHPPSPPTPPPLPFSPPLPSEPPPPIPPPPSKPPPPPPPPPQTFPPPPTPHSLSLLVNPKSCPHPNPKPSDSFPYPSTPPSPPSIPASSLISFYRDPFSLKLKPHQPYNVNGRKGILFFNVKPPPKPLDRCCGVQIDNHELHLLRLHSASPLPPPKPPDNDCLRKWIAHSENSCQKGVQFSFSLHALVVFAEMIESHCLRNMLVLMRFVVGFMWDPGGNQNGCCDSVGYNPSFSLLYN